MRSPRIGYRDTQSYLAIILDDSIRKTVCRLWLNAKQKYVGLLDETGKESRTPVDSLEDIYTLAENICNAALRFDEKVQA